MSNNRSFQLKVNRLRQLMPLLATGLLILVYLVSAAASGLLLSGLMQDILHGFWLAMAIGFSIQIARGTLVFFPQLNPNRPNFSNVGEWIAIIMGVVSIVEVISLVNAAGLAVTVAVSMSILMAMGVLVEIFLLREIRYFTEQELMADKSQLELLRQFYIDRAELKAFIREVKEIEATGSAIPWLSTSTSEDQSSEEPDDQTEEATPPQEEVPSSGGTSNSDEPIELPLELINGHTGGNGNGAAHH